MATTESECAAVDRCLLDAVKSNEDLSSFENSCTGLQRFDSPKNNGECAVSVPVSAKRSGGISLQQQFDSMTEEDILNADASGSGWTKSLEKPASFSHEKLMNKLVRNSGTMPDKMAPKAYRNMKKGYGLWKEGYVKNTLVKADVSAYKLLFFVKARVSASMTNVSYLAYVRLNQISGEVEYAKCPCKAGQGGCCKHVAALLYTMLDFVNLNLKAIPTELTCTQLPQKWNVPSGSSKTLDKAVKFDHLLFEKADVNKTSKRCLVKGISVSRGVAGVVTYDPCEVFFPTLF